MDADALAATFFKNYVNSYDQADCIRDFLELHPDSAWGFSYLKSASAVDVKAVPADDERWVNAHIFVENHEYIVMIG